MTEPHEDPTCEVAHGRAPGSPLARTLVAVFASPVADYLLRYASDVGFRTVLLEPDAARADAVRADTERVGAMVTTSLAGCQDGATDVVVTDHHRPELGTVLRDALAGQASWIGVMGSPRHPAPHIPALAELGVAPADVARVHRPIGLNIGSKTPAEIAISTVAGLIAEHNDCPGGFAFSA
jgi:xanthine dehydrogenase accessory factor